MPILKGLISVSLGLDLSYFVLGTLKNKETENRIAMAVF